MIELFTHTIDVPTWFAIFVLVLLFWAVASAYTWWVAATSADALIELIAIREDELRDRQSDTEEDMATATEKNRSQLYVVLDRSAEEQE